MKKKIIHLILLSCIRATELIEKKSLFGLSWIERLQLRLHTNVCEGCTIYQQQSILLDKVLQAQAINFDELNLLPQVKNESLKQSILLSLDQASD